MNYLFWGIAITGGLAMLFAILGLHVLSISLLATDFLVLIILGLIRFIKWLIEELIK